MTPTTASREADILSRLIRPERADLAPDAARALLAIAFGPEDVARMQRLSESANAGGLSVGEQEELDGYERVGHLIGILQSKARASLTHAASRTE